MTSMHVLYREIKKNLRYARQSARDIISKNTLFCRTKRQLVRRVSTFSVQKTKVRTEHANYPESFSSRHEIPGPLAQA